MQIEEVGVRVCNVARKTHRVGETSRYFTIILQPTVIDVVAKSQGKKSRGDQVEKEHVTSIRDIGRGRIVEAKVRKMREIVACAIRVALYG